MKGGLFVVHYSPLEERRLALKELTLRLGYETHWITETSQFLKLSFSDDKKAFGVPFRLSSLDLSNNSRSIIKSRRSARVEGMLLYLASFVGKRKLKLLTPVPNPPALEPKLLELSQMHLTALYLSANKSWEWLLVLEDDAVFNPDLLSRMIPEIVRKYLQTKKPVWINLSSGANLVRTKSDPVPDNWGIYRIRPWGTRCSSGYLINSEFVKQTLSLVDKFGFPNWAPIDNAYQIIMRGIKAKTYWQDPSSIQQGSETGIYKSNLNI